MNEPLMPSDARRHLGLPEPGTDSARRTMQWYVIPMIVALLLVGAILVIGRFAGRGATIEVEVTRALKEGLEPGERVALSRELIDLLEHGGSARGRLSDEYLLLALGRIWQRKPGAPPASPASDAAQAAAADALVRRFASDDLGVRKAAILAFTYWHGSPQAAGIIPRLLKILSDPHEDLDVRISAAVTLGSIASPSDDDVIAALEQARNLSDETQIELAWNAALSLARLGQESAGGTLLKLLYRQELARVTIYDREADPRNPQPRKLNDYEIERFLINAIEAAGNLHDPKVTARLKALAEKDPSRRVRATATEVLAGKATH